MLGYLLRHGDPSFRDPERARSLLEEAGRVKHYRADDGRAPFVRQDGTSKPAAGTLSHIEYLVDGELLACRIEERDRMFNAFMAERKQRPTRADFNTELAEFMEFLSRTDPAPERVHRRIAAWLESGSDNVGGASDE